jgi:glyoxylase-like metal-dependent hydrolase (beta-lactamase superfamily II)
MPRQSVYLRQLELGPMQNFIYLIGDPERHEAAVVDPGWEVPQILAAAERDGYRLTQVFVTHHHFDHVMGLEELLKVVDLPVFVHRDDAPFLKIHRSSLRPVAGGDTVPIGRVSVTVLHTPGHTPGSQCLLVKASHSLTGAGLGPMSAGAGTSSQEHDEGRGNLLLSGDTLFIGACGRSDLPGGDPRELYESLTKRLAALDDRTVLCPGHNYGPAPTTTLGEERRANPFLRIASLQEFLRLVGG